MIPATFRAFCLLLLLAPAWAQVTVPDTPVGRNFAAMLHALNSRDRDVIAEYIARYGRGEAVDDILQSAGRIGALSLVRIVTSEPLHLQFVIQSDATGFQLFGMLEVEDADSARVAFSLPWVPVPPGAEVIGFDIDADTRSIVVDAVAAKLSQSYVLPEPAAQMASVLLEKSANGDYAEVTNGWVFANLLTRDLRAVNPDKHLVVGFSPIKNGPPMPGLAAMQTGRTNPDDCGFERTQTLPGDIGYVKINRFVDPNLCAAKAMDVLRSLVEVDSIVFDLRDGIGGNAGMPALLVAHLFGEPVQMSAMHWRQPAGIQEMHLPEPAFSLAEKPVFVLTSPRTFSGAEWFAYDLKALNRATIVGETTGGGAHAVRPERIDERFGMNLPYARPVNPITGSNWEGVGVQPDVAVAEVDAMEAALDLARQTGPK